MRSSGRRPLLILSAVAIGAIAAHVVVPAVEPIFALLALAAAFAGCTAGLVRNRPRDITAWRLLWAGLLLALLARVADLTGRIFGLDGLLAGGLLPLAAYAVSCVGVAVLGLRPGERPSFDRVLAHALVASAGALVAFVFIVLPAWRLGDASRPGALRSVLPVLGLALAAVLLRVASRRAEARPATLLLAAAFLTFVLSDVLLVTATSTGAAVPGALRLLAPTLIALAALHPSVAGGSMAAGAPDELQVGRGELVTILLAGVAGPVSLIIRSDSATQVELVVIGVGSAVLVSLVLARLWQLLVALREVTRREHEDRFRALIENAGDVIFVSDLDGTITYVSPTSEWVWGYPPEEFAAAGLGMIVDGDRDRLRQVFRHVASSPPGTTLRVDGAARHKDGSALRFEAIYVNRVDDPAIGGVVITSRDVTDRYELERRLWNQAFVDQLTGLPNRAQLLDRLDAAIEDVERGAPQPSLVVLGIDGFKTVNDSLGPQRGDELLRTVAGRLQSGATDGMFVARLGSDEFGLLLTDPATAGEPMTFAERATAAVGRPIGLAGRRLEVQVTGGVARAAPGRSGAELLRDAEAAMSTAKQEHRGRCLAFDPEMQAESVRRLQLQLDLAVALEQEQLWVAYQPIHELRTGRMTGVEALVRWDHPLRGAVSPGEFVPLAEASGRIGDLGEYVLRRACRDIAEVNRTHDLGLSVAVNLSPAQLGDPALLGVVASVLDDSGLLAGSLTLEVTEGVFLERNQVVIEALGGLRELGVRIAIDDFGTGYCALGYLTSFWFDVVKIDRSFIRVLDGSGHGDQRVTLGILELVAKLEVPAVAEGIESEEQLEQLRAVGCEYGQGFLFSRPVPLDRLPLPEPASTTVNGVRHAAMTAPGPASPRRDRP